MGGLDLCHQKFCIIMWLNLCKRPPGFVFFIFNKTIIDYKAWRMYEECRLARIT